MIICLCRDVSERQVETAIAGLLIFEQTLWDAVPRFLRSLDESLKRATGRPLPLDCAPLRFGSWMGGDRDGNPTVTPRVTNTVIVPEELRPAAQRASALSGPDARL